MKCAIVISNGYRQIMLTPENNVEREALKYMEAGDDETMSVLMKSGTFDDEPRSDGWYVEQCRGGHLRRFADSESLMVIIERTS